MEVAGDSLGEFVGLGVDSGVIIMEGSSVGFAKGSSNGCLVGIGVGRDDVGSPPIKVGEGYKVHINSNHRMST